MPSRGVTACLALGVVLLALGVAFPWVELAAFHASVSVETPPEDPDDEFGQSYAFEDLDPESQAAVEEIIESDGDVTLYAPRGAQHREDGALPPVFGDTWLDSHTLGAFVRYEGTWYRIALSVPGAPLHYPLVMAAAILWGVAVLVSGAVAHRLDSDAVAEAGAVAGAIGVVFFLWVANVSGYVWPIQ